jgi:glutamate formiminotransferase
VVVARAIASLIREGGVEGLEGVRAIGVALRRAPAAGGGRSAGVRQRGAGWVRGQVSMNVERPAETPLREVVAAVRRHAEVACAELVGLAPAAALAGFPRDVPIAGFDPARQVIENALSA